MNGKRLLATLALCAGSLMGTGCTSTYWEDRGDDLMDSFHAGAGYSEEVGLHVFARASFVGIGWLTAEDVHFVGNDFGYKTRWCQMGASFVLPVVGTLARRDQEYGPLTRDWLSTVAHGDDLDGQDVYLGQEHYLVFWRPGHDARAGNDYMTLSKVELGLHVLWGGISLGLDPLQMFDFVLGFAPVDLLSDDEHRSGG